MTSFILNNKLIQTNANTSITLLDFVRYEQRLTGTKIGCREGDCGACSVLVGTLQPNNTIKYKSITSCISPLGNAQGKHIVTIEGTNLKNDLTISQKAMKDNYATQCGFCTPGFVVSLTSFCLSDTEKKQDNALNAISGNICRCTGYKSIEKATSEVCTQLATKKENTSTEWLIENKFIPAYFKDIPKRLSELKQEKSIEQNNTFVSGGTDLYVQKADDLSDNYIHLISEDKKLKGISIKNNVCTIGAGNVVSDLWNHPELNSFFPNLKKHLKLVSSEQIRNMASLGGNLVNASPIGDMTIFFLALNSTITIVDKNENERNTHLKDFYKNYKVYDLNEGELLKSIHFKLPTKTSFFNFEKVSKRTHLDIASVNSAMHIITEHQKIKEVHISMGGVAAIPKYLNETVAFLEGKTLHPKLIIEANKILQKEIAPISDVRGTSDYKRLLARQLFSAHFTELFPNIFTLNNVIQHA